MSDFLQLFISVSFPLSHVFLYLSLFVFLPGMLQFLPEEPGGQEQTLGPTHRPSLHPPAHLAVTEYIIHCTVYKNRHWDPHTGPAYTRQHTWL